MRTLTFHRVLGVGATGTVFLAELVDGARPGEASAVAFSRKCAAKVMKASNPDQEQFRARMRDEARLLGMLQDEQILGVTELVDIEGHDCVVMEYVEGADLAELIGAPDAVDAPERVRVRMPAKAIAELGAELAGTLHRAHTAVHPQTGEPLKVIHRDVKPSNVMVTARGGVRLLDFGAARAAFETRESHTQGLVLGTLNYFPPEILAGAEPTPGVDLYGLGLSLWECASGAEWGTPQVHRHRFERRVEQRLADLAGEYEPLVAVLRRLLSWRPQDRPTGTQAEKLLRSAAEICAGANLRTWAADRVPPLLEQHRARTYADPLLGRTVEIRATEAVRQAPPSQPPPRPGARLGPPPTAAARPGRPRGVPPPPPDATVPPRPPVDPGAQTWVPGAAPNAAAYAEAPTEVARNRDRIAPPAPDVAPDRGLAVDPRLPSLAEQRSSTRTYNDLAPPAAVARAAVRAQERDNRPAEGPDTGPVPELPLDPTDEESVPASALPTTRLPLPSASRPRRRPPANAGLGRTFAWLSLSALLGIGVGTAVLVLVAFVVWVTLG